MYTVKHAAALTGIPPATLRAWERRYGVVTPVRTDSGYRLYDDVALRRLAGMHRLVEAGWSARQAAAHVLASGVDEPADAERDDSGAGSSGEVLGDPGLLARLAVDLDAAALDAALDDAFALGSFEQVVERWLMPALRELGEAWRAGRVGVAGEHFVTAGVHRRLATRFDAAGRAVGAPRVVVGLARGSRHELGVLAFATALRRAGLDVLYVGGDLPPEEWVETVARQAPAAVVIGVPSTDDLPAVRETVAALVAAYPDLPVRLGGGAQHLVSGPGVPLGHSVSGAARSLADELTGTSAGAAASA